ncbi:MAG: GTP-binding protein [Nitrososphaerota archaeon]|nr:GTP-binding protein [Candidatus Bathyarchaeota archaeon]MDW8048638.1 GTP-binding protein [Nitrososphaerota archaeon]
MRQRDRIRNVGIIAHIDHGKTTLTDSMLSAVGLLPRSVAGEAKVLDYLREEQRRGITIKTANIMLPYRGHQGYYLINLVDTPGHVDFTGKVARALRMIDGAVVVVDAVEGIMAQTETVIRQALNEMVKPILFINKVDRLILELKFSLREIADRLTTIISDFNNLISIYSEPEIKDKWKVNPSKGTVAFGSALHKWGLTIEEAYRIGVRFKDIFSAYRDEKWQNLEDLLPLGNTILSMITSQLPSPSEAQKYRIPKICKGDPTSDVYTAMLNCDSNGPLVMAVTSTFLDEGDEIITVVRIFSGKIVRGGEVYLMNSEKTCRVRQIYILMGSTKVPVDSIEAGNIAALGGIENARAGETITDAMHKNEKCYFSDFQHVSEPVITIALEPKDPKNLSHLINLMQRICVEDPDLSVSFNEDTGEYLLSGIGELHLEIAINAIKEYDPSLEIISSQPIIAYRETVGKVGKPVTVFDQDSGVICAVQVVPLEREYYERGSGNIAMEIVHKNDFERILKDDRSQKFQLPSSILAFEKNNNILINMTKKCFIGEAIQEEVVLGFKMACQAGPLCHEPLRCIIAKLVDAQPDGLTVNTKSGQMALAIKSAILNSILTANPVLLQPVCRLQVSIPTAMLGNITPIITRRDGKILKILPRGHLSIVHAHLPYAQTLGLASELRSASSGYAFWQIQFDHWQKVPETMMRETIEQIRKRKGLPPLS